MTNGSGVTISDVQLGFRSLTRRDLSGGCMSPPVIRIELAWVGFEGLGKGIQDLCLGLRSDMWRSQGVSQQLGVLRCTVRWVKMVILGLKVG